MSLKILCTFAFLNQIEKQENWSLLIKHLIKDKLVKDKNDKKRYKALITV